MLLAAFLFQVTSGRHHEIPYWKMQGLCLGNQGWAVGIFSRAQRFLEQDDHSHKIALMRPWTRWRPFWAIISIYEQIWQETTTSSSSWNRNSRYSILPIFLGTDSATMYGTAVAMLHVVSSPLPANCMSLLSMGEISSRVHLIPPLFCVTFFWQLPRYLSLESVLCISEFMQYTW